MFSPSPLIAAFYTGLGVIGLGVLCLVVFLLAYAVFRD